MPENVLNRIIQSRIGRQGSNYFDSQISRSDFIKGERKLNEYLQQAMTDDDDGEKKRMEIIFNDTWESIVSKINNKDVNNAGWWHDAVNKWLRTVEKPLSLKSHPSSNMSVVISNPGRFSTKK